MDPSVTTSIVSGGLGAVGSIASGLFSAAQGRKSRQAAREEMEKQRQFSKEVIAEQNAYNDPAAQAARLRRAGLNPALAAGEIAGNAYQSQPANSPGPIPEMFDYSQDAQGFNQAFGGVAQAASTALNTYFEASNLELQKREQNNRDLLAAADNLLKNSQNLNVQADTILKQITSKGGEISNSQREALFPFELQNAQTSVKERLAELSNMYRQGFIMDAQFEGFVVENMLKKVQLYIKERLGYEMEMSELYLNYAQAQQAYASASYASASATHLNFENEVIRDNLSEFEKSFIASWDKDVSDSGLARWQSKHPFMVSGGIGALGGIGAVTAGFAARHILQGKKPAPVGFLQGNRASASPFGGSTKGTVIKSGKGAFGRALGKAGYIGLGLTGLDYILSPPQHSGSADLNDSTFRSDATRYHHYHR